MKPRRPVQLACALLGALVLSIGSANFAGAAPRTLSAADDGAKVVQQTQPNGQMLDVIMQSPAVGTNVGMRLLLPPGWTPNATRTWPVLYLLPGCCEPKDFRAWTELTDIAAFAKNKNVLIAMPTDGANGNFSDWWNYGKYGPPNWEKFHLDEMRQILERNYHAGQQRAVAGLSAGAYGAMEYASRRPGMFQAAAAFSGTPNVRSMFGDFGVMVGNFRTGQKQEALWGDPVAQADIWKAHNPYDNAENLRGTRLYIATGNGFPGPLHLITDNGLNMFEMPTLPNSLMFVNKLNRLNIPVTTHFYGAGTHMWGYWIHELKRAWPLLTKGF